ncbi:MAG TPA: hypothetical protein VD994_02245, partial [Prosthecobacter sp.]|nr:hypothetical protein [Prosthecobacter sp.]
MKFEIGALYTADEIQHHLEVGNAGGIRVSLKDRKVKRVALLTVVPSAKLERENPYHDRVEGDVLVYSAAGLQGDQSLAGVNKRLPEQSKSFFPVYGFRLNKSRRKAESRRWEFLGLLQFLRVSPDNQLDRDGRLRRVWSFELRICSEFQSVEMAQEQSLTKAAFESTSFDSE